jgi:DNA-binding XRE family transcriptional regulator
MAISKLETDQMKPSYETMQKLARYFGLSVDRLFF